MQLGWSSVQAAANKWHLVGFLFFSYHNDARSNKHQIYSCVSDILFITLHPTKLDLVCRPDSRKLGLGNRPLSCPWKEASLLWQRDDGQTVEG